MTESIQLPVRGSEIERDRQNVFPYLLRLDCLLPPSSGSPKSKGRELPSFFNIELLWALVPAFQPNMSHHVSHSDRLLSDAVSVDGWTAHSLSFSSQMVLKMWQFCLKLRIIWKIIQVEFTNTLQWNNTCVILPYSYKRPQQNRFLLRRRRKKKNFVFSLKLVLFCFGFQRPLRDLPEENGKEIPSKL